MIVQEYVQDGVEWTRADFMDNTECLNLFEKVHIPCPLLVLILFRALFSFQNSLPNDHQFFFNRSDCDFYQSSAGDLQYHD